MSSWYISHYHPEHVVSEQQLLLSACEDCHGSAHPVLVYVRILILFPLSQPALLPWVFGEQQYSEDTQFN